MSGQPSVGSRLVVRARVVFLASVLSTGCLRARATAGGAFSARDLDGHSGLVTGADLAIGLDRLPLFRAAKPTAFGLHITGEALLAERFTDLSWGTGIGYFKHPDPVAGYATLGTNFHVDRVEGRDSFGSVSPYLEFGVAAPVDANSTTSPTVLTLGIESMLFFNFLLPGERAVLPYYALKFGLGFDGP
ncbi:MAG TPA: hypothetical protein VHM70_07835 [Polyangiaceae bacterium]|nr:hypothetical protein [Polyangiaceae bacterium]